MASNLAALKKKAADFEAKKQFDKAIAAYREVLDAFDDDKSEEPDVALYNRVGDLMSRQGQTADAVVLYERAVDLYTEGGFFNNAIALCSKVLRASPGRASIYYKLGKISAKKGFKGEAKQNFLEYADRMQKADKMDEAFRALKEFADLVPDQDDVRLMLAEQLTKAGRKEEAIDQLQILYQFYEHAGRSTEAEATVHRMKAIDPTAEPKQAESDSKAKGGVDDLIFIDLNAPSTPRKTRATRAVPKPSEEITKPRPVQSGPSEEITKPRPVQSAPPPAEPEIERLETITSARSDASSDVPLESGTMLGLEPTSFAADVPAEPAPMAPIEFAEMDLNTIEEVTEPKPVRGTSDLALAGDLPSLDTGMDLGGTGAEPLRVSGSLMATDEPVAAVPTGDDLVFEDASPLGVEPTAIAPDAPTDDLMMDLDAPATEAPTAPPAELIEVAPETPTGFGVMSPEVVEEAPPVRRSSSLLAKNSVMVLRVKVTDEPENWALRRQLAEALLEDGDREEGLRELEATLIGMGHAGDLEGALSVTEEFLRLNPSSLKYHQKRVEFAYRLNDKPRLAEAYLALADALFREGQQEKAKTVYQRVLEILPDDIRAQSALESFVPAAPAAPAAPAGKAAPQPTKGKRYTAVVDAAQVPAEPAPPAGGDDDFISLGDFLRDDEGPKSTRMVVEEEEPTGDEQADFSDMLKKFKQGIAENVEDEDHESHYDLGVAFKEMGLVDEAIAEFQKALRGTQNRTRTYEALGQCFLEKKQLPVAVTILQRALNEPGIGDEQLVGVLYLLGYTNEALAKHAEAKAAYERVFAVDIQFRDVGDRLNAVEKAMKS